jgi:hypothetical protein
MKTKMKKHLLIAPILFSLAARSQTAILSKYEVGGGPAIFIYQGDLTPNRYGSFRTMRPGGNIFVSRLLSASSALRLNLAVGSIQGDDGKYPRPAWRQQRNFRFTSPVVELSVMGVWNVLNKNYETKTISPYLLAGGGVTWLSVKRDLSRFNSEFFTSEPDLPLRIAEDMAHPLPKLIPVIPAGVGVRYPITQRLSVYGEGIYRFTFSDYIDGFSKAVSDDKNDHYYTLSAGIIYRFGRSKLDCPEVK